MLLQREFKSGYVSRVELDNFKSWRGKQAIGPFHNGFTAVIGPNGAGKSNLMDSISFVTGLKAKRLRGDQLRDLIYDADKLAEEQDRKMSVSMAYTVGHNEVEGMRSGEEIIFTRSVVFSVPGCQYHIGNRRVTYEEYEQMFNKLNILTSARNFLIFQGDVEATAAKSPSELTLLFEQISGSDVYKQEYEQLEREKERMEAMTLERIAQAKLAKQERKEAKEQKEITDKFNALVAQKERVAQELAMFQLLGATEEMDRARAKLELIKQEVAECEAVEEANAEEVKKSKSLIAQATRSLAQAEAAWAAQVKTQTAAQLQFSKKSEAGNRERAKRREAQDSLKQAREDVKRHSADVEKIKQQIEEFTLQAEALQEEMGEDEAGAAEQQQQQLTSSQREEMEQVRAEADEKTNELRSKEANAKTQLDTLQNRLAVQKSNFDQLEARVADAMAAKLVQQKKKQSSEKSLQDLQQQQTKLEAQREERQRAMDQITATLLQKQQQLAEAKQILGASKAKSTENKRSKKLQDTVQALARHFPGVRGRLVDLIRPTEKKYALAVDTCLGRHMDSVVIDRESTAFECVRYLREQRLGTATFLPLDTLRVKPIAEAKRKLAVGPYRMCFDLIEFEDAAVERAVRFAAGEAMVCNTLEDARKLCFQKQVRVKAVTLEGHVISQRGEMTGGAMGEAGKQDRFADAAAHTAKETKDRLEREIAELERMQEGNTGGGGEGGGSTTITTELLNCTNRIKFTSMDLKKTEDKLKELETRLEEYRLASEAAKFKLGELESEFATKREELESIRSSIAQAEDDVFGEHHDHHQFGAQQADRRRQQDIRKQKHEQWKQVKEHVVKLESQLRFISSKNRQDLVEQLEQQVEKCEEQITKLETEAEEAKQRTDDCAEQVKLAQEQKKRCEKEFETTENRAKESQSHLAKALKDKSQAKKDQAVVEDEVQKLVLKREEVIRQSALDGVDLPKKEDGEYDFSLLKNCKRKTEHEFVVKIQELKEEAAGLTPNARAEARLLECTERVKDCDTNLSQSREETKLADEAFEKVRSARHDAFTRMFSHVSLKIDSVYKELTKRQNAPLGGSAFLALEDEEGAFTGGIKFECMPPNKRYRAMEQLSGGEKTIAALALLFAIHTYRPSPFFVLDEVDAALDNDNVERVSNYIRMRSNRNGNEDESFRPFQCLVISLKDGFFSKSESLVGVYREVEENSSRALTLNLSEYAD